MAAYQYIYVMQRLTKIFPGGKKVLENITLAFLPGAKIGVLGVNGAGKSTLMKIMAGLDKEYGGEAWAAEGDGDAAAIRSNVFTLEWPPHSGRQQQFPEIDRAAWFSLAAAREKIIKGQVGFLEELQALLET